jgi:sodium-coupled neutral amino acid transporter 6
MSNLDPMDSTNEPREEETKEDIDNIPLYNPEIDPKLKEEERVLLRELKHHQKGGAGKKDQKYSDSYFGATFNLVNATVGSGILGLPFVIRETGLIFGVGFLMMGACVSMISLSILRIAHKMMLERDSNAKDYEDIGYNLFGSIFSFFMKLCIILINFGAVISYLIILGQVTSKLWGILLGKSHVLANVYVATLVVVLPVTFLSMLKRMNDIRWISYFSLTCVFCFVIYLIAGFGMNSLGRRDGKVELGRFNPSMLRVLGIITFSFGSHTNLCSIHSEFRLKDSPTVGRAVVGNIVIDFVIYTLCGTFGYLSFLKNTRGNLLDSLDLNNRVNLFFVGVFLMSIFLTVPVTVYPARLSLDNLLKSLWSPWFKSGQDQPQWFEKDSSMDWYHGIAWRHFENIRLVVETILILVLGYVLAISVPHVETVFSITGSTASACTSYLFPAMFYLKLTRKSWLHWSCLLCVLMFVFGVVFGLGVTTISILTTFGVIPLPTD